MMIKICQSDSWNLGGGLSLVKFSSRGLLGSDRARLIKLAGEEFAHLAAKVAEELLPGEEPGHLTAMGATEWYGNNRNGDGWKEAMLRRCHKSFETHSHAYRNHQNKDARKSYGRPKLAYYNPLMGRVELLVAYNGDEKTASANDGLVADKECEALHAGRDFPVSMACKVAFDVCSACHNKAANRKEYCESLDEGGTCMLFGCKSGLTKVADDGHVQHVDNPDGVFFDISYLDGRPADRIAYGCRPDYLAKLASVGRSEKVASVGRVIGGAELGELYEQLTA